MQIFNANVLKFSNLFVNMEDFKVHEDVHVLQTAYYPGVLFLGISVRWFSTKWGYLPAHLAVFSRVKLCPKWTKPAAVTIVLR